MTFLPDINYQRNNQAPEVNKRDKNASSLNYRMTTTDVILVQNPFLQSINGNLMASSNSSSPSKYLLVFLFLR